MSTPPLKKVTLVNRCPHCAMTTKTTLFNIDPHVVKMTCIHCGHQFWGVDLSTDEPSTSRRRGLRGWWRSRTDIWFLRVSVTLLSIAFLLHLISSFFTR